MHDDSDDWLRAEFKSAGDEVLPGDGLSRIRERVAREHDGVSNIGARRGRSVWVAIAAVAATVVVATTVPRYFGKEAEAPPASATATASSSPSEFRDPAIPVYYAASGDLTQSRTSTDRMHPLAREFHRDDNSDRMLAALRELTSPPQDPDYVSFVPAELATDATEENGVIEVAVSSADWAKAPNEMPDFEAQTAVMQIIYTVRAVVGKGQVPVTFTFQGEPMPQVLGVHVATVAATPDKFALAPVNLTSPDEGASVSSELTLSGRGLGLKQGSRFTITDAKGTEQKRGSIALPDPSVNGFDVFKVRVDVSDLDAGDYLVSVTSASGLGRDLPDTKQFTIR